MEQFGEPVEQLVLIEPMLPGATDLSGLSSHRQTNETPVRGRSERNPADQLLWRNKAWIQYQLSHLRSGNRDQLADDLFPKKHWPAYWYHTLLLAKHHAARPFSGPAVFIGAPDEQTLHRWRTLVPELRSSPLPDRRMDETTRIEAWRERFTEALLKAATRDMF